MERTTDNTNQAAERKTREASTWRWPRWELPVGVAGVAAAAVVTAQGAEPVLARIAVNHNESAGIDVR